MSLRAIYYDTETTGINIEKDRIIEIAAYDPLNDTRFETLVNPGIPIPEEASKIHGISNEQVNNAPSFFDAYQKFANFCSGNVVLIAHNNDNFDAPLLKNECLRHSAEVPAWPYIDSLKWARIYRPDLPKHNLQYLRQVYGLSTDRAHRALNDVLVLYSIFDVMIDDLPLDIVLKLIKQESVTSITHMPFGKHQGKILKDVPKHYVTWLEEQGFFNKPDNANLKQGFCAAGLILP
ncbi:putative quorum-sensing-regulated virulence factor [Candidatus Clavichlamydia salmonicola]|uniref:putative quorum-sensing-regulated virulence factor n=1 Tax=Candidatus Clavichlamydia salmonicola TaxID=469812 RepID=UPI001891B46E|nr:DUF3820 family protein [Candidatus Clavichlamydia salmonicola]